MTYKIDGVDLSTFGAIPSKASGEVIFLSGLFSLPKRTDTTEYDWGTSIEPFVDADDIELDGRTLTLNVAIKGASLSDLHTKLATFKTACIACTKLYTEFDEFDVIQKGAISVDEYFYVNMATVEVPFWQQDYIPEVISIEGSGNGSYRLDAYDLIKDFGIYLSSWRDINNTAARIDISTTLPYTNTSYRSALDLSISCKMKGFSLSDLYTKMSQFNALCVAPGTHTLKIAGNADKTVYFKDGITTKAVAEKMLSFDLKCRVIS